jgi:hypothetical protein
MPTTTNGSVWGVLTLLGAVDIDRESNRPSNID